MASRRERKRPIGSSFCFMQARLLQLAKAVMPSIITFP
jgi:hypothetical protein